MDRIYEMADIIEIKVTKEMDGLQHVYGRQPGDESWYELRDITPMPIIETVNVSDLPPNFCKHCNGTNTRKETLGDRMYCSDCKGFYEP